MIWNRVIPLHQRVIKGILQTQVRNITLSKILREDYYKALGISRDATQAEIKNAYFELSKIYHPDRIAATDENLAKFRAISAAYEVLGNEQSRKLYDRGLDAREPALEDDPIVKFYQQRQRKSQVPTTHVDHEELDQWTQEVYRSARKETKERNDLFKTKKISDDEEEVKDRRMDFGLVSVAFLGFLFCCSVVEHPFNRFFSKAFDEEIQEL